MNGRLFAIGDIHGCIDSFRELIEYKIKIKNNDKLVLLGDYIDRGNKSKEVVDYIIDLQLKGFDIIPLMGNHEAMLIDSLNNEDLLLTWIFNGGAVTLKSFGIKSLKDLSQIYIDFFRGLHYYYLFNHFLFVHAGFNDEMSNPFEDKYQMIWTRREEYTNPLLIDKIIIHGHSPVTEIFCRQSILENRQVINIDTGCVYSDEVGYGRLSAIELYSKELFST
jgi:serine/threonine protein phosphatase 1